MTASNTLQVKWAALQARIFAEKYHVALYLKVLGRCNMSTASIDQHEFDNEQIVKAANMFWFMLPDYPSIRRGPFMELCNIAEGMYG